MNRIRIAFTAFLLLPGCTDDTQRSKDTAAAAVAAESSPHAVDDRLLEIAATYESYGRFSTQPRLANAFCAPVTAPGPPLGPRTSGSGDAHTHGKKLYYLFVKEVAAYTPYYVWGHQYENAPPSPVGQVVVKESWVPEEVKDSAKRLEPVTRTYKVRVGQRLEDPEDKFLPFEQRGEHLYHAKEKWALFIMYKLDPKTPGTDNGWVYGTVTADGKKATAGGPVDSCMGCHKDAPHDRLFGFRQEE